MTHDVNALWPTAFCASMSLYILQLDLACYFHIPLPFPPHPASSQLIAHATDAMPAKMPYGKFNTTSEYRNKLTTISSQSDWGPPVSRSPRSSWVRCSTEAPPGRNGSSARRRPSSTSNTRACILLGRSQITNMPNGSRSAHRYDHGIQTFDTANVSGNLQAERRRPARSRDTHICTDALSWQRQVYSNGLSEVALGKAIKELKLPRDELVIMTKVGGVAPGRMGGDRANAHTVGPEGLQSRPERSLFKPRGAGQEAGRGRYHQPAWTEQEGKYVDASAARRRARNG